MLALLAADVGETVRYGAPPVAVLLALAAGLVSFASPCVLPLVPGFLGYVTGLSEQPVVGGSRLRGAAPGDAGQEAVPTGAAVRNRVVGGTALFVLGFTAVFVTVMAAAATAFGALVREQQDLLTRVGGLAVIVLAPVFLGFGPQRELAVRYRPAVGLLGAPLLGVVFGLSLTPCIGPTFGAIVAMLVPLSDEGSVGATRGVALATAYSLGLGVPFLLMATGWARARRMSAWLRRHQRGVQLFGGSLLLAIGVLMVSGLWDQVMAALQTRLVSDFETVL